MVRYRVQDFEADWNFLGNRNRIDNYGWAGLSGSWNGMIKWERRGEKSGKSWDMG